VVIFSMDEADVRTVLAHPSTMIGSDGVPARGASRIRASTAAFPESSATTCARRR
jgi:N-acyl-D-aspartate/D-glutamate deacylase